MTQRPLRILILGINYAPESIGIAPYTAGMAASLAARGHDIEVFTGYPHYPHWHRGETRLRFRSREKLHGVRIRRFKHPVPKSFSWFGRAVMEIAFGLQIATARWGRRDVVICVSPPLLAAAIAVLRARLTPRRPAVGVVVQDIYTRGIEETGATSGSTARVFRLIESATLKSADGVSAIHGGFTRDLANTLGVPPSRMREIRNWTHVGTPDPAASRAFRAAHGWSDEDVIVLHAGNMGYKQGLENLVAAAELADQDALPVRFVLIGGGNQRRHLESLAVGTKALEFIDLVDDETFPAALGAADVLLVNERRGVAHMSVPSKLTSYFKSGKPVLAAVDPSSYAAFEIGAAGAGVCVPPDRPDLLLSEALRIGTDRNLAGRLGQSGQDYSDQRLSRQVSINLYDEWVHWLTRRTTAV